MKLQYLKNKLAYEVFFRVARDTRLLNFSYSLEDNPPEKYPALVVYSISSDNFVQDWRYIYKSDFSEQGT